MSGRHPNATFAGVAPCAVRRFGAGRRQWGGISVKWFFGPGVGRSISQSSEGNRPMDERGKRLLVEILLVEDNPSDVLLTQIAMKECKIANRLHVANDGEAAIAFLR